MTERCFRVFMDWVDGVAFDAVGPLTVFGDVFDLVDDRLWSMKQAEKWLVKAVAQYGCNPRFTNIRIVRRVKMNHYEDLNGIRIVMPFERRKVK